MKSYPEAWDVPDVNRKEVQAIIKQTNWNYVPKTSVRKLKNDDLVQQGYDERKDPGCWWSAINCVKPKVNYLPQGYYTCPKGEWGLTYDDGPFNLRDSDGKDAKLKIHMLSLDCIITWPRRILRELYFILDRMLCALSDGHTLCSHTWSSTMTTLSNQEAVAEFYWILKAIKEATGVTPKCWRLPQGDVDDRIRSIAWQMGMSTVIWNKDTQDWQLPAPGNGHYPAAKVEAKFEKWIKDEQTGNKTTCVIVLEHELNHATVNMTETWMPKVKRTFNVVSAMTCNDALLPYWETTFKYPAIHNSTAA